MRPWDSLRADEKRLFCRMAEVYAGFVSHCDHQLGRLLDYLEQTGDLDNTIIVAISDNGASGEGGPNGTVNEMKFFNGIMDTVQDSLQYIDELGSPSTYNHYATVGRRRSARRSRCTSATPTTRAVRPTL